MRLAHTSMEVAVLTYVWPPLADRDWGREAGGEMEAAGTDSPMCRFLFLPLQYGNAERIFKANGTNHIHWGHEGSMEACAFVSPLVPADGLASGPAGEVRAAARCSS